MPNNNFIRCVAAAAAVSCLCPTPASAEMVLSKVIVDLRPGQPASDDIEVWNSGPDRLYVVAEPSEIQAAGTEAQTRVAVTDPAKSGLVVSPQRMILEPGQRRLVRIAAVLPRAGSDRVYRVAIKPVAGRVTSTSDALKVFVGYDVLVIQRPNQLTGDLAAAREGKSLSISNRSNTAWEIYDGKQCDERGTNCVTLPATRLYPRADFRIALRYDTAVEYRVTNGMQTLLKRF